MSAKPIEFMRARVETIAVSLEPGTFSLIDTSRGLQAIVDKRFEHEVRRHCWYALVSRGDHIHIVGDVNMKRITLQRLILTLEDPTLTFDDVKNATFLNRCTFDCRVENLVNGGRVSVMQSRLPKRMTTSKFKGVSRVPGSEEAPRWKVGIKTPHAHVYLGTYQDEAFAAQVYDAAAHLLFGATALFNFSREIRPEALDIAKAWIEKLEGRLDQSRQQIGAVDDAEKDIQE